VKFCPACGGVIGTNGESAAPKPLPRTGKGFLIDFNYDVEPLPGMFPMPGLGPFSLLKQSRVNHWGKVMFRWTYWNVLLKGKEMPIPAQLSMAGKWR
jgi:sulfide:quinone oxidoreductase